MRSTVIDTPDSVLSLVAFSTYLEPENRTDRVIAEAWDSSYVLYDGFPDSREIERSASYGSAAGSSALHRAGPDAVAR